MMHIIYIIYKVYTFKHLWCILGIINISLRIPFHKCRRINSPVKNCFMITLFIFVTQQNTYAAIFILWTLININIFISTWSLPKLCLHFSGHIIKLWIQGSPKNSRFGKLMPSQHRWMLLCHLPACLPPACTTCLPAVWVTCLVLLVFLSYVLPPAGS